MEKEIERDIYRCISLYLSSGTDCVLLSFFSGGNQSAQDLNLKETKPIKMAVRLRYRWLAWLNRG